MKKVRIVREINFQDFENKINELLTDGWEISSNLCVDNDNYLYVMMIKRAAS